MDKKDERIKELEAEVSALKKDFLALKKTNEATYESELSLQQQMNRKQAENERLCREISKKNKRLEQYEKEVSTLSNFLTKKGLSEERAATDQQLRAYKRQVDELRQQLDTQKENNDELAGKHHTKITDLMRQLDDQKKFQETMKQSLKTQFHDESSQRSRICQEYEVKNKILTNELAEYKQKFNDLGYSYTTLQSRLGQYEQYYTQQIPPPPPTHQMGIRSEQIVRDSPVLTYENRYLDEKTRRADEALRELDEARSKMTKHTSGAADGYRQQVPPPPGATGYSDYTHEEEESGGVPYDPNLVCPRCNKRYRFGEIQKLRRHLHEFCPVPEDSI